MSRKTVLFLAISSVLIVLDQGTKYWVTSALTTRFDGLTSFGQKLGALYGEPPAPGYDGLHFRPKQHITVSEKFFRIRYAENPGAAWGMLRSLPKHIRIPFFHLVSLAAVAIIVYYLRKLSGTDPAEKWALYGLPFLMGGALGNYADRFARGFVIDFLEAHWMDRAYWPSFNVADAAICVGVGLLVVDAFVRKEEKKPAAAT